MYGRPTPEAAPCGQCVGTVLNEQWEHHGFTSRDLNLISGGST
jgi:hypothetical protein